MDPRQQIADVAAMVGREVRVFAYGAAMPAAAAAAAAAAPQATDAGSPTDTTTTTEAADEIRSAATDAATAAAAAAAAAASSSSAPSSVLASPHSLSDPPDDFYTFTAADYSRLSKGHKEERFLKTRAIREQEMQQRRALFKQSLIRVRFPDNTLLEASFAPTEPVSNVREVVRRCLRQTDAAFYLFTTPPKRRLTDESRDLYSSQLTPGALLHFAFETTHTLDPASPSPPCLKPEVSALFNLHLLPHEHEQATAGKDSDESMGDGDGSQGKDKGGAAADADAAAAAAGGASAAGKAKGKAPVASEKPKWFKR